MENLEEALERWRELPPRHIPLDAIHTDEAFQPRLLAALPVKDRDRERCRSAEHVIHLRNTLEARPDPFPGVLLGEIESKLYMVDGHHRLKAHAALKRSAILACVMAMTRESAIALSKLVNIGPISLALHNSQLQECCFQEIGRRLEYGARPNAVLPSQRRLGAMFQVPAATVQRQIVRARELKTAEWTTASCFPGTPWPLWRHARGPGRRCFDDTPADVRKWHRAERLAARLQKAIAQEGDADVVTLAIRILRDEQEGDNADETRQAHLKDIASVMELDAHGTAPEF